MTAHRAGKETPKTWTCRNFGIKEIFATQISDYPLHSFNYTTIISNMPEIYKKANPSHPPITRLSMQIFFEPQAASQSNRVTNSRQRRARQIPLKNNCRQVSQIEESKQDLRIDNNKLIQASHKNSWIIKNVPLFQELLQNHIRPINNNYKAFPRRSLTSKHSRNHSCNVYSPQKANSHRNNYEKIAPSCSLLFLNPAKSKQPPPKETASRSRSLRASSKS